MKKVFNKGDFSWIHLELPTSSDIKSLFEDDLDVPVNVLEDVVSPTQESVCYTYPNGDTYIVVHIKAERKAQVEEYDFLISKNSIVTVLYGESELFKSIMKKFDVWRVSSNKIFMPWQFLAYLLSELYRHSLYSVFEIQRETKALGKDNALSQDDVFKLSKLAKESLDLRDAFESHRKYLEMIVQSVKERANEETYNTFLSLKNSFDLISSEIHSTQKSIYHTYSIQTSVEKLRGSNIFRLRDVILLVVFIFTFLVSTSKWEIIVASVIIVLIYYLLRYKKYL